MKQILAGLLVFGALGIFGCGGDDKGDETVTYPVACKSGVAAVCSKVWGGCVQNPSSLPAIWGLNEADCRTKYEQDNDCATKQCASGTMYNQAKAQECLDQYKALSCDQVKTLVQPAACSAICE